MAVMDERCWKQKQGWHEKATEEKEEGALGAAGRKEQGWATMKAN